MKIALLLPSRNRLNKFLTFLTSVLATTNNIKNIRIVLGIDEDDPVYDKYKRIADNLDFIDFITFPEGSFKEGGLSVYWNTMVERNNYDILAMVGDDMIFKTNDWDKKIIKTFKERDDNIHLVFCNDGMRGPGNKYENAPPFPVNSFVHKDYVDTVGWYVQDIEPKGFQDTYLDKVFELLDRKIYYHDIIIKHMHFSEYGNKDSTTERIEKDREGVWDNNNIWNEQLLPSVLKEEKLLRKKFKI
jgi:hypothetical protein